MGRWAISDRHTLCGSERERRSDDRNRKGGRLIARADLMQYQPGKQTLCIDQFNAWLIAWSDCHCRVRGCVRCAPLNMSSSYCCQPQLATGEHYHQDRNQKHLVTEMFLPRDRFS